MPVQVDRGRQSTARSPGPVLAIAGLAIATGLIARLWLIFHIPTNADAAVVGLQAVALTHGHVTAFFGGQSYGGTAETGLIAGAFLMFGPSGVTEAFVELALTSIAALLTWRVALRLLPDRSMALLVGALVWAAPAAAVRDSVQAYGFRGVTEATGLLVILLALRILDGCHDVVGYASLGLFAGLGWWSSPEIVYYLVPATLILVGSLVQAPRSEVLRMCRTVLTVLVGFAVGALPWIWSNIGSGLASLHTGAGGYVAPPISYAGRLQVFFGHVLPLELGLRRVYDGYALLGRVSPAVTWVLYAVLLVTLALCLRKGGRTAAVAAGVAVFPFLYAVSPAAWFWRDGRYGTYILPLVAMVIACGVVEGARLLRRSTATASVMCTAVSLCIALSVVGNLSAVRTRPATHTSRWGNPDAPTLAAIGRLEAAHITTGFADYWVAYKLDFLSGGRLEFTTAGRDIDRSPGIDGAVRLRRQSAWLFVPRTEATIDGTQFTASTVSGGVGGLTESRFIGDLGRMGVSFRTIDTGLVRAVIPADRVTPQELGLPGVATTRVNSR